MEKIFSYLVIIFIIFVTCGTSALSNDKALTVMGWAFFFGVYLYTVKKIQYYFLGIIGVFAVISILYLIKNSGYDYVTYLGFFIQITLAYFCREICAEHFSKYFINVIFVLTCITLPLFIVQLISFDFLYQLNSKVLGISSGGEPIASSFIFAMAPIHETRNCGFMWEPGAFAAVLVVTIYMNLFHEGESIFSLKNSVFILAIVTTQSTMGFIALLVPVSLVVQKAISENEKMRQISVVLIPILIVFLIAIFSKLDFLSAKIVEQITGIDEELAFVEEGVKSNFVVSTTRLASILIDMQTIKNYPILGIGVDMRTTGASKISSGELTITACGLTNLLMRFGLIGLIGYTVLFYRSALFEHKVHKIGWVVLIFIILTSNELTSSSLLHLFIF